LLESLTHVVFIMETEGHGNFLQLQIRFHNQLHRNHFQFLVFLVCVKWNAHFFVHGVVQRFGIHKKELSHFLGRIPVMRRIVDDADRLLGQILFIILLLPALAVQFQEKKGEQRRDFLLLKGLHRPVCGNKRAEILLDLLGVAGVDQSRQTDACRVVLGITGGCGDMEAEGLGAGQAGELGTSTSNAIYANTGMSLQVSADDEQTPVYYTITKTSQTDIKLTVQDGDSATVKVYDSSMKLVSVRAGAQGSQTLTFRASRNAKYYIEVIGDTVSTVTVS